MEFYFISIHLREFKAKVMKGVSHRIRKGIKENALQIEIKYIRNNNVSQACIKEANSFV